MDRQNRVWILTEGGVATYRFGESAEVISTFADGASDTELPSIIGKSMVELPNGEILISTIWREVFVVSDGTLTRMSERDVSGGYSFALLPDGRLVVALDAFNWQDDELLVQLEGLTGRPPLKLEGYGAIAVTDDRLFGAKDRGVIDEINIETGKPKRSIEIDDDGALTFLRADGDYLYLGSRQWYSKGGCYRIPLAAEGPVEKFFDGACYDVSLGHNGLNWASVKSGVYQLNGGHWRRYFPDGMGGLGEGARLAPDDAGNLWVLSSRGLWRHYDYVREIAPPAVEGITPELGGVFLSDDGTLFVSLADNRVFRRTSDDWASITLPPPIRANPYYHAPVFAQAMSGALVALTSDALYELTDAEPRRIGTAPLPDADSPAPAALAVCPDGSIFAGYTWSNAVFRFSDGRWATDFELRPKVGGDAVPSLACDSQGVLWAMATTTIAARTPDGEWFESGELPARAIAKGNLYGTIILDKPGATAWGSWGYPVRAQLVDGTISTTEVKLANGLGETTLPYVYYRGAGLGSGEQVLLSDVGLLKVVGMEMQRLPLIDDQYQLYALDFAARRDDKSAIGADLVLLAGGRLFEVDVPSKKPSLTPATSIQTVFDSDYMSVDLDVASFLGPPEAGQLRAAVTPEATPQVTRTATGYRVAIEKAAANVSYELSVSFVDAAGQQSQPYVQSLRFERSWLQDPPLVVGASVLALFVLVQLFQNRFVADFLVRRVLRRRWSLTLGLADRTIALQLLPNGTIEATIETSGATLQGRMDAKGRSASIRDLRKRIIKFSNDVPGARDPETLKAVSAELFEIRASLDAIVPSLVSHELSTHAHDEIQFELGRSLSDLPWEMLSAQEQKPLTVASATSRIVMTEAAPRPPQIHASLQATIFAAMDGVEIPAVWRQEQAAVAGALKRAGVKRPSCPPASLSKADLIESLLSVDIVHLIGHGEVMADQSIAFRVRPDLALSADEIRSALAKRERSPAIVFFNACGSAEERRDSGGAVLAGLATPFLEAGSIVIGSLWPVQAMFASQLAVEFYSLALPAPRSFALRLITGRELAGAPLSRALLAAKQRLYKDSPNTDPTWSAYTVFGNVRARLELT